MLNYLLINSLPKQTVLRSSPLSCKYGISHIPVCSPALFQDPFYSSNLNYVSRQWRRGQNPAALFYQAVSQRRLVGENCTSTKRYPQGEKRKRRCSSMPWKKTFYPFQYRTICQKKKPEEKGQKMPLGSAQVLYNKLIK